MEKIMIYTGAFFIALVLVNCSDDLGLRKNESDNLSTSSLNSPHSLVSTIQDDTTALRRIVSFNFELPGGIVTGEIKTPANINQQGAVSLVVPDGTPLTSLTPIIEISAEATGVSPASGVPNNFSGTPSYKVKSPASALTGARPYLVTVTYQNDFLVNPFETPYIKPRGKSFFVYGNFGLPVSDYTARLVNQTTGVEILLSVGINDMRALGTLIPASFPPGTYKVSIIRTSIEKEVPGSLTVL